MLYYPWMSFSSYNKESQMPHPSSSRKVSITEEDTQSDDPIVALWRAVVYAGVKDLMGRSAIQRSIILKWIMTRDFNLVCDLAGFDPEALSKIMYEIAIEQGARQQYILKKHAPWLLSQARDDWEVPGRSTREPIVMQRV
jgi:hypothetical protein